MAQPHAAQGCHCVVAVCFCTISSHRGPLNSCRVLQSHTGYLGQKNGASEATSKHWDVPVQLRLLLICLQALENIFGQLLIPDIAGIKSLNT